jgi:branched-subunit amino acid ABC-type transport system permease component
MQEFQLLAQLVLPGLTTGCVYALVALGFVLCFNVSGVVNMAQGEYVMLGGVVGAWMVIVGVPLVVALIAATAAGAVLGIVQERLTLAPVRRSPAFIQITVTLGVAVVLRGIALIMFGKDPLAMPGFSGDGGFEMLGAILGGLRSPDIAVIGGLGVGVAESLAAGYVSSGWKDAIVYGLLLAFLLIRGGVFLSGRAGLVGGTSDR